MEIIKGNRYVCTFNTHGFTKGEVYTTNTLGKHIVNKFGSYSPIAHQNYEEYFIPYSQLDKVYTKATPLLNNIFKRYDGRKLFSSEKGIDFFDNFAWGETGWFVSTCLTDGFYKNNCYTYLSESAFIEFMDLGKYVDSPKEHVFNPQAYYDNSNGSLYKVATERGWNAYLFDVVKRLERGGKKDPLRKEIEKSIDVLKIWLSEID